MAAGSATVAPRLVTLSDGFAEAAAAPELGAGLVWYDLLGAGGRNALFRPCRDLSRAQPFDLASNLLVPWSNRVSGGGFHFGGRFHRLAPNLPDEPCPIHGNGFSSVWSVEEAAPDSVVLALTSNGPGPFRYQARATYALSAGALSMRLWLSNLAPEPLPFGLGFHPWLVRTAATLLQAQAERVGLENGDHLPAGERLSIRAPNGISPRRARFPRLGSTTPSSAGTAAPASFGPTAASRSTSRPNRRSRSTSSIRPPAAPTSSASSRSPIPSTRTTCLAARRPMV